MQLDDPEQFLVAQCLLTTALTEPPNTITKLTYQAPASPGAAQEATELTDLPQPLDLWREGTLRLRYVSQEEEEGGHFPRRREAAEAYLGWKFPPEVPILNIDYMSIYGNKSCYLGWKFPPEVPIATKFTV